jgi:hypothetical protein
MSTHPEEIEEGEIVSDVEDELSMSEGDMEVLDEDEEDEEEGIDLATPDGDTVCTALVGIGQQIEIQNKILIKILSRLSQKSA